MTAGQIAGQTTVDFDSNGDLISSIRGKLVAGDIDAGPGRKEHDRYC